jgi:anthranilate/para-aminobenzoate synthase component I
MRSPQPLVALWLSRHSRNDGPCAWATPIATFRVDRDDRGHPRSRWLTSEGRETDPPVSWTHDPLIDLDRILDHHRDHGGSWIGFFSYELGSLIEPTAASTHASPAFPLIELHRVESLKPFGLDNAADRSSDMALHDLKSVTGRARFESHVARAIEYIRAGDIFQANIAHHLRGTLSISPREAWLRLLRVANPWHGSYIELAGRNAPAIASLSPELFFRLDPRNTHERRITTRPMKGTRSASAPSRELEQSPKDRAELAMIVDLMRNDLGRICRLGSVSVDSPHQIESHATGSAGLHQATATVSGILCPPVSLGDVLRATFPPGSVTGAPKIRAMQIIDDLEPVARGPYCGASATIHDDGSATLAVAIRTAVITPHPQPCSSGPLSWLFDYAVGAGIVADSDPASEWQETLAKAGILAALGADLRSIMSR